MTAEAASTGQLCQWLRCLVPKVAAVGAGVHRVRPIARSWGLAAYVAELSFSSPRPPATASGSLGLFSVDSEAGPYYQEVGCVPDLCRVAAATNLHLTMYAELGLGPPGQGRYIGPVVINGDSMPRLGR